VGFFLDKPYVKIVFEYLKIEWSWYTESIQLEFLCSQTSFIWVKPRIIEKRSRCFLGKPQKRTRKQSRRFSMILGFSYINSQFMCLLRFHLSH